MTRTVRVGAIVLVLALVAAAPGQALAQRGGEGWWDMIKELSGPRLNGLSGTLEVCVGGLVLGGHIADCPDEIVKQRVQTRAQLANSLRALLSVVQHGIGSPDSQALNARRQTVTGRISSFLSDDSGQAANAFWELWTNQPVVAHKILSLVESIVELEVRDQKRGRKPGYLRRNVEALQAQTCRLVLATTRLEEGLASLESNATLSRRRAYLSDVGAEIFGILNSEDSGDCSSRQNRVLHPYVRLNSGWSAGSAENQGGSDRVNRVFMSPTFAVELESNAWVTFYGSTSITFNRFSGEGFDTFWRHSFDFGVGMRLGRWEDILYVDLGLRARYFPTPFSSQDFGGPVAPVPNGGEWALGPGAGIGIQLSTFKF